jgi:putative ATP-dependent endonuclease of OLD family
LHRVSYLDIRNFRACEAVSIPLSSYTPLVGQNNSGKSSVLDALEWVLSPRAISESDFSDRAKPVEVCACIEGINDELLARLPEPKHRKAIEPYCADGRLWIQVSASLSTAKKPKRRVFDHTSYCGEGVPNEWREYPTGFPEAVSALLPAPLHVHAMDDLNEDLGKAKAGTTIKGLLDEVMDPILEAHEDLRKALGTVRDILTTDGTNRSELLANFDTRASDVLDQFFPGLALQLDLQSIDIKEFFKAGDLRVTDKLTGDQRRFDQMGTGAQRAIQMALIRYLAEARVSKEKEAARRLLIIDEPELYLHPQAVRRLREGLLALSNSGFQVVFSTHSPIMLSRENAADTIIVGKSKSSGTFARIPLRAAVASVLSDHESQARTLFELGNLAEIYFSDRVVLCEGKTDRRLLPLAYEGLYDNSPDLDQTCFVAIGSCSDIPKALPVLRAMGIKAFAIVDLDFAFVDARKGKQALLDKNGKDLQDAKEILRRLQLEHGFALGANGLPQKDGRSGWTAADTWSLLAQDEEGRCLIESAHEKLKADDIWVWVEGSIENVTGFGEKGEDAIIEQERRLASLTGTEIEEQMGSFKRCLDWVKSL